MSVYVATTEGEVAMTAAATNVVLQLATTASQQAHLRGFGISFDGTTSSAEPMIVSVQRSSTAGSGGSALTETKFEPGDAAATATAVKILTVNPTLTDYFFCMHAHPQGGGFIHRWEPDARPLIVVSGWVNVVVVTPSGVNPNCTAWLEWEE